MPDIPYPTADEAVGWARPMNLSEDDKHAMICAADLYLERFDIDVSGWKSEVFEYPCPKRDWDMVRFTKPHAGEPDLEIWFRRIKVEYKEGRNRVLIQGISGHNMLVV